MRVHRSRNLPESCESRASSVLDQNWARHQQRLTDARRCGSRPALTRNSRDTSFMAAATSSTGMQRSGGVSVTRVLGARTLPPRHVAQTVKTLVGKSPSPGRRCWPGHGAREPLAEREERTNRWLLASSPVHVAETLIRIDGRKDRLSHRGRRGRCVTSDTHAVPGDDCPCIDFGGSDRRIAVGSRVVIRLRRSEDGGTPSRCSRSRPGTRQPRTPVPRRGSSEVGGLSGHSPAPGVAASG